jgi:hypothetical protein
MDRHGMWPSPQTNVVARGDRAYRFSLGERADHSPRLSRARPTGRAQVVHRMPRCAAHGLPHPSRSRDVPIVTSLRFRPKG